MTKLPRGVISAAIQTTINDHPTREAGADADVKQVADVSVLSFAVPDFCESRTTRGVVDDDRQASGFFQQLDHRNITPRQDH